jgi:membrane dipeptidase
MTEALDEISPRAKELLRTSLVWDNHGCMPLRTTDDYLPQLERYRKSGVNVISLNVGFAEIPWEEHIQVLSYMRQWVAGQPDKYRLVRNLEDVHASQADGRLGITFDIEGMFPVQDHLNLIQTFYELGVRWMLIAYNKNNKAGGGCLDEDTGLTAMGRAIIDEMERVGMVLCVTHTGARTAAEALGYARNPVIFSHSNPLAVHSHPRNISDKLMRMCARKGGVVGINGIGPFLGQGGDLVEKLLEHLRYAMDLIGPQHVGLGLDYVFDSTEMEEFVRKDPGLFPSDVETEFPMVGPEAIPRIAEELSRNYTDDDIRGVLGGNWLRVASQVWR